MYRMFGEQGGLSWFDFPTMCLPPKSAWFPDLIFFPFILLWKFTCRSESLYPQKFSASAWQDFSIPTCWFGRHEPQPGQRQRCFLDPEREVFGGREGDLQWWCLYPLNTDRAVKFRKIWLYCPQGTAWSCLKDICATVVVVGAEKDNFHPNSLLWGACLFLGVFLHRCLQKLRGLKTFLLFPVCRFEGKLVQIHHP